jgi:CDP-diacylglycerol--serine O-phosphatidyltransferase
MCLLLGLGSIVTGQLGNLELAGWMIVWCGLLDVMDGLTARLLKATSTFGAEFDSMADLVAFGVAPAMLVLQTGMNIGGVEVGTDTFLVLLVSVGVFVLAGAARLARYNLTSNKPSNGWFAGLPITAAGGALVPTAMILLARHEEVADALPLHVYLPIGMFVLASFMISRIRYPKAVRRKSNFINGFQIVVIISVAYFGVTRSCPEYLFFIAMFLLIAGIIAGRINAKK